MRARGYMEPDYGRARYEMEGRAPAWSTEAAADYRDQDDRRAALAAAEHAREMAAEAGRPRWGAAHDDSAPAPYDDARPGRWAAAPYERASSRDRDRAPSAAVERREVWRARPSAEGRERRAESPPVRSGAPPPWAHRRAAPSSRYEGPASGAHAAGGHDYDSWR